MIKRGVLIHEETIKLLIRKGDNLYPPKYKDMNYTVLTKFTYSSTLWKITQNILLYNCAIFSIPETWKSSVVKKIYYIDCFDVIHYICMKGLFPRRNNKDILILKNMTLFNNWAKKKSAEFVKADLKSFKTGFVIFFSQLAITHFDHFYLFHGISIIIGYLMPKPFL